MTHAAIEACLAKIKTLIQQYRAISGLNPIWLDNLKIERVFAGGTHPLPKEDKNYIYAGTVYQVYQPNFLYFVIWLTSLKTVYS